MCRDRLGVVALCALFLVAGSAGSAQTTGPRAPTDKAQDFKRSEIEAVARDIAAKGLITQRILEGGTYSVNVRHIAASETALVHAKITEVWVVREGSGVVVTGGSLIDPKPGAGPGDLSGSGIKGGVERVISTGDLVFIPPGVPHGIKQTQSITYLNIRWETK